MLHIWHVAVVSVVHRYRRGHAGDRAAWEATSSQLPVVAPRPCDPSLRQLDLFSTLMCFRPVGESKLSEAGSS